MAMLVSVFFTALAVYLLYGVVLVIYRLFFHPLARFPGPKLAAATRWYEFYHDIIKDQGGRFAFEIDRMHNEYGPIVRINPDELHIKDSEYFSIFYTGTRHKHAWAANLVGAEEACKIMQPAIALLIEALAFGTKDHDLHKIRRTANVKYLSKRSVVAHEPLIVDSMRQVMRIIDQGPSTLDLHPLFLAFTTEVAWLFTLNQSSGLLEDDKARLRWQTTMQGALEAIPILKQFSWIMTLANALPLSVLKVMVPPIAEIRTLHDDTTAKAHEFLKNADKTDSEATIFHAIYSSTLPESEKTAFRLSQEAFTITTAAGNTTTHTIVFGIYYILSNPEKMKRFQKELRSLKQDIPSWTTLSSHPYIRAVIKEVSRLRGLVAGRNPLLAPSPLQYGEWVIPGMTAVSLSIRDVLHDPKIFKDPESFIPERWLENSTELDQYFVPFGKGSRNCQGLELAWAELYIVLGTLFRNYDMELVDLDYDRDIRYQRECLVAMPSLKSKSVRVKIRRHE